MPPRPYHLLSPSAPRPVRWRAQVRATQPGLAAWWRLLAPGLWWARAHAYRLTLACFSGASVERVETRRFHAPSPSVFALPHRERLVTVTRGPMARKKQSRVQFLVRRQVVCLGAHDVTRPMRLRNVGALAPLYASQRALAEVWGEPLGSPFTRTGARLRWPVVAPALLVWR